MSKIPENIVTKIEMRNLLDKEIDEWCQKHLDMDGMDSRFAEITDYHKGDEQFTSRRKEWCDQHTGYCEDDYYGDYFWETKCNGKYLHMHFSV